jgi:hypothetical protein
MIDYFASSGTGCANRLRSLATGGAVGKKSGNSKLCRNIVWTRAVAVASSRSYWGKMPQPHAVRTLPGAALAHGESGRLVPIYARGLVVIHKSARRVSNMAAQGRPTCGRRPYASFTTPGAPGRRPGYALVIFPSPERAQQYASLTMIVSAALRGENACTRCV